MVESGVSWLDSRVALLIAIAAAACSRVSRSCWRVRSKVAAASTRDTSRPPTAKSMEIRAPSPRLLAVSFIRGRPRFTSATCSPCRAR